MHPVDNSEQARRDSRPVRCFLTQYSPDWLIMRPSQRSYYLISENKRSRQLGE